MTLHAYEAFSSCPVLYALPIVEREGRPVGLINRFRFLEQADAPVLGNLPDVECVY